MLTLTVFVKKSVDAWARYFKKMRLLLYAMFKFQGSVIT